ncbi:hypothetical protein P280DRAFT_242071 [Massarina eburnea CBS 473.64]|uniref:Uncharacterized protein n=1 Tax=Massarina eburnea CBS 473.64 TaxID=1395130 RepID=A0A6A6SA21_9PLEO|nr:hypothetical protein P280DRAFT_242071 [Massarina eburnea CBS 473.64]
MRLPVLEARSDALEQRMSKPTKSLLMVGIIAMVIFVLLIITYILSLRLRRFEKPRSPQDKLPSLFSWRKLLSGKSSRGEYSTSLQGNELSRNGPHNDNRDREMSGALVSEGQNANDAGVDRNTSVRSVMTLPAYAPVARENERILGREGERGGIDTVVEFPETNDDEEERREGEMESLYQIRVARRAEAREREERREARREARMRGDQQALADIRRRTEQAAEESRSQLLIAEHQGMNRDRRVSSVQYGDLGVARHDGTRIRANSTESDNRPLLDSAASISGSRAGGNNNLNTHHQRGASASSVLSVSSRGSEDYEFPEATQSRSNSDNHSEFEVVSLTNLRSRSGSRGTTPVPALHIPHEDAPAYESPPNYESPINTRAPVLPTLDRLPSIHITIEPTPVEGRQDTAHEPPDR